MIEQRVVRLCEAAEAAGLDAVGVVPGPNMRYLTGLSFHLSERPTMVFFPVSGTPVAILPQLEVTKLTGAPFEIRHFAYRDEEGPDGAFADALGALGLGGAWLGVEGRRIRFLELDKMARTDDGPRIFDAAEVFAELRMVKDALELDKMRRAVAVAERALEAALPTVRPGATEREVAAELTVQLLRAGSEPELPFAPIVATGRSGARPHAVPSERAIEPGDLITLDWGASWDGYFSDITRTYAVAGAPLDPQLEEAYEAVRAANAAGRAAVRPGVTGSDVDRAARSVIEDAGFGTYFVHRTGHGLGLEAHEEPDMAAGNQVNLKPGMTFTVEPGVYIPDVGGVRIEDDIVVTTDGGESLTTLPRELHTVG